MIVDRDRLASDPDRELALACVEAGIAAAAPAQIVERTVSVNDDILTVGDVSLDLTDFDEIVLIGGGKGAARLAGALEAVLGDRIDRGAVVTNTPGPTNRVDVLLGDHPIPSANGVEATRQMLDELAEVDERTLVLVAITGGGSALMTAPAPGVGLDALQLVTNQLLSAGATIGELNAVRKHLSTIKGGGLAAAAEPATVLGIVLSDVVGNDLAVIASGPTAPDSTTFDDALAVLDRFAIDTPPAVREHLRAGRRGDIPETPGPDDPRFSTVQNVIIADGMTALRAAETVATNRGYAVAILSSQITGESRVVGGVHAAIAAECVDTGNPLEPPAVLLSGGETTVTVTGSGSGGPNQEFILGGILELDPAAPIVIASVDTDGIDGATDAAGGVLGPEHLEDRTAARAALADNDAYAYLQQRGAIIETGPTGTNLNDLRVLVVGTPD